MKNIILTIVAVIFSVSVLFPSASEARSHGNRRANPDFSFSEAEDSRLVKIVKKQCKSFDSYDLRWKKELKHFESNCSGKVVAVFQDGTITYDNKKIGSWK